MHIKTFRTIVSRLRNLKEVERIRQISAGAAEPPHARPGRFDAPPGDR
jgi:hypothetical protein